MTSHIAVSDASRKAAADLLDEISDLLQHNGIGQVADLIRDGEFDEHEAAQAFARHRLAALDEAAEVARNFYDGDARASYLEASSDIADAIDHIKETPDAK